MLKNTTYDQHGYTPNLYKNQNCEQKVKIGREIGEKKNWGRNPESESSIKKVSRTSGPGIVEEARKHSELLDRFHPDVQVPDNLSEHNESLDWDSNEVVTSPSFVKKTSPDRDRNVEEIIQNILNSSEEENPENWKLCFSWKVF